MGIGWRKKEQCMGHLAGKDIYRKLGKKIDGMPSRAPWNDTLHEVLKSLYSVEEADVVVKMPFNLSSLERIARITRRKKPELQRVLEGLSEKGLVVDLWVQGRTLYMPSPMVVGIFEFTMMRTGGGLKTKEWAKLFHEYMHGDSNFYAANFGQGQKISIERALPHEGSVHPEDFTEILDHEKAHMIVEQSSRFAIGICSCRHEKLHADKKTCDIPLEMCASFGAAADYLVRRNLAKEASRTQMHELIDSARGLGLVLNADNIQKNVSFICSCCPLLLQHDPRRKRAWLPWHHRDLELYRSDRIRILYRLRQLRKGLSHRGHRDGARKEPRPQEQAQGHSGGRFFDLPRMWRVYASV
jgi:hypothetical protein